MGDGLSLLTRLVEAAAVVSPGLVWGLSLVVGPWYLLRAARRERLDETTAYFCAVAAVVGGILGSHLLGLYVYRSTNSTPEVWWHVWEGGKSFLGGAMGGGIAAVALLRFRRRPVLPYLDAMAPAVGLGYAVGRLACFLNGDDFGIVWSGPLSVQYPPGTEAFYSHALEHLVLSTDARSLPVAPAQLVDSLLGLVLFLALRRQRPVGVRAAGFLVLYGMGRYGIELIRGDFTPLFAGMSLAQLIALGAIAGGAVLRRHAARHPGQAANLRPGTSSRHLCLVAAPPTAG